MRRGVMRAAGSHQHRLPFEPGESLTPAERASARTLARTPLAPDPAPPIPHVAALPPDAPRPPHAAPLVPDAPPLTHVAPLTPGTLPAPAGDVRPTFAASVPVEYVRHARARRYLLRVRIDGSVRATIPRGGSKREAQRFVESQASWIAEQQRVAAAVRAARRPPAPRAETAALKRRAAAELPPRLQALAQRFGLTVHKISIRNQRWRWGSCSRQAHICLNWRLIQMPDWVRDYVLIHELMHLRRMDHSPAFWAHVARACPEYARARAWLREHGNGLTED